MNTVNHRTQVRKGTQSTGTPPHATTTQPATWRRVRSAAVHLGLVYLLRDPSSRLDDWRPRSAPRQPAGRVAGDALGRSAMLDAEALITSTDPATGQPVNVTVHDVATSGTGLRSCSSLREPATVLWRQRPQLLRRPNRRQIRIEANCL